MTKNIDAMTLQEIIDDIGNQYIKVHNGWIDDGEGERLDGYHAHVVIGIGEGRHTSHDFETAIREAYRKAVANG